MHDAGQIAMREGVMGPLIPQLDLYLSRYAPANSFTQLVVPSKNDGSNRAVPDATGSLISAHAVEL
ncbi:hypothetical protein BC2230_11640 [Burkholderia cepacia]